MRRLPRARNLLVGLLAVLPACAHPGFIDVRAIPHYRPDAFFNSIGVSRLVAEGEELIRCVKAFQAAKGRWPSDYGELQREAAASKRPLRFDSIRRVSLEPAQDGELLLFLSYQSASPIQTRRAAPQSHVALVLESSSSASGIVEGVASAHEGGLDPADIPEDLHDLYQRSRQF